MIENWVDAVVESEKFLEEKHNIKSNDFLQEKLLAFNIDLGKLAEECLTAQFWDMKYAPSDEVPCHACQAQGGFHLEGGIFETCTYCSGTAIQEYPLIERYADCLTSSISIGLHLGLVKEDFVLDSDRLLFKATFIDLFNQLFNITSKLKFRLNLSLYGDDVKGRYFSLLRILVDFGKIYCNFSPSEWKRVNSLIGYQ